jgi:hypothetical protein
MTVRYRVAFGPGARLSALQAASFAGLGIWMPFFPVWLGERGVGADAIGSEHAASSRAHASGRRSSISSSSGRKG